MEGEVLFDILNELTKDDFETFKWFLKNKRVLQNFPMIPNAILDEIKRKFELVDVMVQTYDEDAIKVTMLILGKINRADLLNKLQKSMPEAAGQNPPPAAAGDGQHSMDTGRVDHDETQMSKYDLRKYSCKMQLDVNSAHGYLKLSNNNRKVECVSPEIQPYPSHPDRFDPCCQVLCSTALKGRCSWEVEWSGAVQIAVVYKGIKRKSVIEDCVGENAQSWSLWCSADGHSVRHNKIRSILPHSSPSSGRIAVYLDHSAGSLSFYKVSSGDLIHFYTYKTKFTQDLYAGFWLGPSSSVSLCDV